MSGDNKPTHRVYSVISRDGRDDFWLNIGLAFTHQDGKGLNVLLQALPLPDANGGVKLVLRDAEEEQAASHDETPDRRGSPKEKPQAASGRFGGRR